jgi:hypothetical protein
MAAYKLNFYTAIHSTELILLIGQMYALTQRFPVNSMCGQAWEPQLSKPEWKSQESQKVVYYDLWKAAISWLSLLWK